MIYFMMISQSTIFLAFLLGRKNSKRSVTQSTPSKNPEIWLADTILGYKLKRRIYPHKEHKEIVSQRNYYLTSKRPTVKIFKTTCKPTF